ncbi:pyruvate:ferredoxin (flavodoxin) oxidoreductase [Leptogranulimonas caecicola]|uniref:Pyruvate:ferredoxin (Flavodoxin) oxidoreductase n=1 Tax=Muricaecibacterium torontonense TaxID=3032871 RepID=A0A4S2F2A8_9ACTN|nr:pyruvate:ferredoxin (flavodoxin) oxidoreductase [Muricaecibacterium torontonense]MCI8675308.1 pyruvate:ferredoxin (flavodoxin) oxidoreductase [Atopobiaceae bacterium]TGY63076.1 pyruvate:ferredoxin (flavodoxin) oxidoreductase [Muricaecibacterium torontonense]
MARKFKSMDGNEAAAWVSYAFTEVASIYPITPSSPMADHVDQWAAQGLKNIFGTPVKIQEMESEAGAAGAVHGSLGAGALTTSYTASQGLLLMIPNMYKMAGEGLPNVLHVSARTVATQALNIFGDHSDVMACRQTGYAMLAEGNVQEVMDLAPVAHLAAIEGSVPFLNFFDGFRTSHEIQKVATWDFEDLKDMVDMDAVQAFRDHALNPEHPTARGSHENGDIFFQHREACNSAYNALPQIVQGYMDKINEKLGTSYHLFDYYGAADADRVVVCMGSFCDTLEEVIDYLNAHGEKVGLVKVRLYRPWSVEDFAAALPKTVKKIAVLDRTKEPGSIGEPLYQDVITSLVEAGITEIPVIGGRYGLGSKDEPPAAAFAVYEELKKDEPKREFTIGIEDDVTFLSLPMDPDAPNTAAPGTIECKFWGLGGDGTVGANKNSIKIIGDHTDKYVQAYFQYDSKKTGGVTVSHLRFGDSPIRAPYYVTKADFVACHNPSYIIKGFKMVRDVKPGGIFLVNSQWSDEEFAEHLPAEAKRYIAENNVNVYLIDAIDLAQKVGMGKRTNTVLQSAFFALADILPAEEALQYMKDAATKSYSKKGDAVVAANHKAIDAGATAFHKFEVPADWANATEVVEDETLRGRDAIVEQVQKIMNPINRMDGDSLPVSAFAKNADGAWELGASAYEKRGTAVMVPRWDPEKCIQCNNCAYVCPHAAIRPIVMDAEEQANAPEAMKTLELKVPKNTGYTFTVAVSPLDCMGCYNCLSACPKSTQEDGGALTMVPQAEEADQIPVWDYAVNDVTEKRELFSDKNTRGSQFSMPMLEFSGSCAGCAETSYARLVTQLFGDRMFISNATGCSSIWGNPAATSPFTCNAAGHGPAWNNSLFEDNAEHGLGLLIGYKAEQNRLAAQTEKLLEVEGLPEGLKEAATAWLENRDTTGISQQVSADYASALVKSDNPVAEDIAANKSYLSKKSFWIFGGDGWAYDIGFGGLDHVLASGENVNVFVFDTEVYSNTGGQASKASNLGQVAQFAASGKSIKKKPLAEMMMSYGYVYVAQVAMGANPSQLLKALAEAEAYDGPSLIIGYSPCEMHSIKKGGMLHCQEEQKRAVDCGYWNLFRFNPAAPAGKRFVLDSKAPKGGYQEFLENENRYASLRRFFPDRASELFAENEQAAMDRYEHLLKLQSMYDQADEPAEK